jgi:hypothetical protein
VSFGPLYAYVHPLDLEWWCWQLARAQGDMTGVENSDPVHGVSLLTDQVLAIEDVFADPNVPPGQMRLRQTPLTSV